MMNMDVIITTDTELIESVCKCLYDNYKYWLLQGDFEKADSAKKVFVKFCSIEILSMLKD